MASKLIGRTACPECGFASAHVKQSEKCVYRYCPECAAQHHARTERQRADLLAKTRLVDAAPTPTEPPEPPTAAAPAVAAAPTPTPREPREPEPLVAPPTPTPTAAPRKRIGLFTFA